ncbi:hypothetical protein N7495_002462 [Penicillium taxi]|uniref:uncharacterized protein n=1 Tax=Penicillium taxi TaxID=168475 RepID=UPI00254517D7|nr:uncharacterized protein N7495_002462 [Penicillium taxi]KAJ5901934.1 hypothetical protein N7495_002462 [Penicillium taxi]
MATKKIDPQLGFWEIADLQLAKLSILGVTLYASLTGIFRSDKFPKKFKHHVMGASIRAMIERLSNRQMQYYFPSTQELYASCTKKRGLKPEVISLPHDAEGFWLGNKNAKKIVIYYHGGGFAMSAIPSHLDFWLDFLQAAKDDGHDVAVFFLHYSLTPSSKYPTQLRQAVEALRYIVTDTDCSPRNVVVGGDSAGGNLAIAVLLHLSHPNPKIDPLPLSTPLAGVFCHAPWIDFKYDWPSMKENAYRDIITAVGLEKWSGSYLNGKPGDSWSEPSSAPVQWWAGAKTEQILLLAGGHEILLSSIDDFAKKIKSVFPNTTYIVGPDESHDAHLFLEANAKDGTHTSREVRKWVLSRL